jgi:YVTN family beta-propeller protein
VRKTGLVSGDRSVFISYRRASSKYVAVLLRDRLAGRGFDVFLDLESLDNGRFEDVILDEIARRAHFVVLIDPDTRLGGPAPTTEWMQREIARALVAGANIVPVMVDGARFGDLALPEEIAGLADYNAVAFSHDYLDASVDKVARFLSGVGARTRKPEALRRLLIAAFGTRRPRVWFLISAVVVVLAVGVTTTLVILAPTVISVAGSPEHLAMSPTGDRLYVSGQSLGSDYRDSFSVIDTATEKQIASIPFRARPGNVALSFDGGTAYVPVGITSPSGSLAVVNLVRTALRTEIPLPSPVGGGVALSRDGTRLFVSLRSGSVVVIDPATNRIVGSSPPLPDVAGEQQIELTKDGNRLYLSGRGNAYATSIWAIDTRTLEVVSTLRLGTRAESYPDGLVISDDGRRIYVADGYGSQLWVVDPADTLTKTITLAGKFVRTRAIAIDRHGWVVTSSTTPDLGAVLSFSDATGVLGTVRMDTSYPDGLAFSQDGTRVFVADSDGVHVISMSSWTPT